MYFIYKPLCENRGVFVWGEVGRFLGRVLWNNNPTTASGPPPLAQGRLYGCRTQPLWAGDSSLRSE